MYKQIIATHELSNRVLIAKSFQVTVLTQPNSDVFIVYTI